MPLNLDDSTSQSVKSPLSRGSKLAAILVSSFVVWALYIKFSPSDERHNTAGQAMALINRTLPPITAPAEKEPAPMPQSKPQAQAPRPQPQAKAVVKKEKDMFAEMQKEKRLAGIWAWPTPNKQGQSGQHSNGETLEIPPASSAGGMQPATSFPPRGVGSTASNVWNSDFYNRKRGQAGPLQQQGEYSIWRGWKIPCRLNEPINTDSPGQVSCTVVNDVYDSQTGRVKLIPEGAGFVGAYDTQTYYGQEQIAVSWDELQFPNGTYRSIPSMPGADRAGVAGVPGEVNNHLFPTVVRSALLTVTGATAMALTHGGYNGNDMDPADALGVQAGRELRRGSEQVGRRGMNRPPTVTAEAGEVILIQVTAPIRFDGPYRDEMYAEGE